ncbi:type III-A CRISPR-associated RAMP protein Csm3 [Gordonibacter sp. An230]|uniref:type III-A CRISPR-associated RAMP protein Csm3 n=1 Tax=Gordonibacter sp. An230 TaxID=1965592 RepID=UPI000B384A62|nr:type III-A CRISPR-associated RAMP protein Csm3 [Gordonibacter sp. An230]OUO91764.1 type III-A CRISPR-associated RAMP protein Csm3 [Gordonibacter sp. An230]
MAFTATKIKITGIIEVKTGLHIGGDASFSAIGAIDLPVVRDPLTRGPVIPGSTLKGKLRTLLARQFGSLPAKGVAGFESDAVEVLRLFGSSKKGSDAAGTGIQQSRLMFKDAFLVNKDALPQTFETKFENTIDRLTAVANPRQIERVVRGAKFDLEIVYNVENADQIEKDFENIQLAFDLLRNDYLGGGGTRGNGRVDLTDIEAQVATGDLATAIPELR